MTVSGLNLSILQLQELFYRCKFSLVLDEIAKIERTSVSLDSEILLIKANTLFEMHRVHDSLEVLGSFNPDSTEGDENHLYALARVSYLNNDREAARATFTSIYNKTPDKRHRFKSLLGIANTYYTDGNYALLPPLIERLCGFEPLERDDDRISLMIFLGNYYFASGASMELARTYFKKALSAAASKTWSYFISRSLFGLAKVCDKENQTAELAWTLDLLRTFVDEDEQLHFSYLLNERFNQDFSINTPVEFDTENHRILIKNRWLPFHDKPLLFQFLLMLHKKKGFVSKDSIASELWPEEGYKPRVHDPRIFDIAKRARQLIEAYEDQPVVLLSGRTGYKLASS